jgi:tetratricopeptide (TPR) repeat protein
VTVGSFQPVRRTFPEEKETVSAENNHENQTQELELWERISTTEGAERAEVLDELSHIAYRRDDYNECIQLVDTSIDIYFKLGMDSHIKELIHLYEGKAFSLRNLDRLAEAAETFEEIAKLHQLNDDTEGYIRARRAAACDWYEVKEWQKCLDGHSAARDSIDPDATSMSMGIDLLNIGMALSKLEQHQDAIENYLRARKLFQDAKNPDYVNWVDQYATVSYAKTGNGMEAKFHAKHYFNYSKVSEDLSMEGLARYRLGEAHLVCLEFEDSACQLTRALELLNLDERKDWVTILGANHALVKALVELGREEEAITRLERISTIEETMGGDANAA